MEAITCGSCDKPLSLDMEIEYSRFINEFFCNPECAKVRYFDYLASTVFDKDDIEIIQDENVVFKDNQLFTKEEE